jgi:hypothetical protein
MTYTLEILVLESILSIWQGYFFLGIHIATILLQFDEDDTPNVHHPPKIQRLVILYQGQSYSSIGLLF